MYGRTAISTFVVRASSGAGYEELSKLYVAASQSVDYDWTKAAQVRLAQIGNDLSGSTNTIVLAYSAFANALAINPVSTEEPLSALFDAALAPTWTGPTAYATVAARVAAEAAALRTSPASSSALRIADLIERYVEQLASNATLSNYNADVLWPSLVEAATPVTGANESADSFDYLDQFDDIVNSAPRIHAGTRPGYTVTPIDTLESIARAVYGDGDRWPELTREYQLSPPYLSPVPRAGCLAPGTRIVIPHDALSLGEEEAYGAALELEVVPSPDGTRQDWDFATDPQTGLVEVTGLAALETDLSIRLTQPLGDWPQPDVADYGIADGLIGSPAGIYVQDFLAAQAALGDPRVANATPVNAASSNLTGLYIGNIIIEPIPILGPVRRR